MITNAAPELPEGWSFVAGPMTWREAVAKYRYQDALFL